uniref:Transmembrane protein n=1 Tax=Palpitomonas bilix TaxID=652834 RepID=A0A7S3D226_9EUKA|mmetsp:Transcript_18942/g.48274  ORF Transcript_18942/g.48274 Transcript_18942/m.48274 type:complete len:642 (+) Transcript_18942:433-2358(+)
MLAQSRYAIVILLVVCALFRTFTFAVPPNCVITQSYNNPFLVPLFDINGTSPSLQWGFLEGATGVRGVAPLYPSQVKESMRSPAQKERCDAEDGTKKKGIERRGRMMKKVRRGSEEEYLMQASSPNSDWLVSLDVVNTSNLFLPFSHFGLPDGVLCLSFPRGVPPSPSGGWHSLSTVVMERLDESGEGGEEVVDTLAYNISSGCEEESGMMNDTKPFIVCSSILESALCSTSDIPASHVCGVVHSEESSSDIGRLDGEDQTGDAVMEACGKASASMTRKSSSSGSKGCRMAMSDWIEPGTRIRIRVNGALGYTTLVTFPFSNRIVANMLVAVNFNFFDNFGQVAVQYALVLFGTALSLSSLFCLIFICCRAGRSNKGRGGQEGEMGRRCGCVRIRVNALRLILFFFFLQGMLGMGAGMYMFTLDISSALTPPLIGSVGLIEILHLLVITVLLAVFVDINKVLQKAKKGDLSGIGKSSSRRELLPAEQSGLQARLRRWTQNLKEMKTPIVKAKTVFFTWFVLVVLCILLFAFPIGRVARLVLFNTKGGLPSCNNGLFTTAEAELLASSLATFQTLSLVVGIFVVVIGVKVTKSSMQLAKDLPRHISKSREDRAKAIRSIVFVSLIVSIVRELLTLSTSGKLL